MFAFRLGDSLEVVLDGAFALVLLGVLSASAAALVSPDICRALASVRADRVIRIQSASIEVTPQRFVRTTTYNGQFPGPLLRMHEGRAVIVDIRNDMDIPEQLHFHGQIISADIDGAAEAKTPYIPARGARRISFTPRPSGFRFYHTHLRAGGNIQREQYNGEVGPFSSNPRTIPAAAARPSGGRRRPPLGIIDGLVRKVSHRAPSRMRRSRFTSTRETPPPMDLISGRSMGSRTATVRGRTSTWSGT